MKTFGLVLHGTWRDGRRNALMPRKYQTCRRQTQKAKNKIRKEGLKVYADMTTTL